MILQRRKMFFYVSSMVVAGKHWVIFPVHDYTVTRLVIILVWAKKFFMPRSTNTSIYHSQNNTPQPLLVYYYYTCRLSATLTATATSAAGEHHGKRESHLLSRLFIFHTNFSQKGRHARDDNVLVVVV